MTDLPHFGLRMLLENTDAASKVSFDIDPATGEQLTRQYNHTVGEVPVSHSAIIIPFPVKE